MDTQNFCFVTADGDTQGYRVHVTDRNQVEDSVEQFAVMYPEKRAGAISSFYSTETFSTRAAAWTFARKDFFARNPNHAIAAI
jgi:hypothetical protein